MILTKKIEVGINYKNIKHFLDLGYNVKCGQKIIIPIEHISKESNKLVEVKCDVCGKIKIIKYQCYVKDTKYGKTYYACSPKCAKNKNKETNMKLYGVEYPMQSKEILNKSRETVQRKYGVKNISQSEYFKIHYKDTMLFKYGVENGFQSEEIKQKSMETMEEKYGVPYNMQREEMKEKYLYGENNNFYIDGTYVPNEWNNPQANIIRTKAIIRDNRTCDICGQYRGDLQTHHLYSRNNYKDLIYDINNLITLCKKCHKEFHDLYGYGNNTLEQYEEFKQSKKEKP